MQEKLIDAITADSLHEDVRVGKLIGNEGLACAASKSVLACFDAIAGNACG